MGEEGEDLICWGRLIPPGPALVRYVRARQRLRCAGAEWAEHHQGCDLCQVHHGTCAVGRILHDATVQAVAEAWAAAAEADAERTEEAAVARYRGMRPWIDIRPTVTLEPRALRELAVAHRRAIAGLARIEGVRRDDAEAWYHRVAADACEQVAALLAAAGAWHVRQHGDGAGPLPVLAESVRRDLLEAADEEEARAAWRSRPRRLRALPKRY
jgi:hypothetical protein